MRQPPQDSELGRLFGQFPRAGRVQWIGLRPARDVPMQPVDVVLAEAGRGLAGDLYAGGSGKRGVTLLQAEHLPVQLARSEQAGVVLNRAPLNVAVVVKLKGDDLFAFPP